MCSQQFTHDVVAGVALRHFEMNDDVHDRPCEHDAPFVEVRGAFRVVATCHEVECQAFRGKPALRPLLRFSACDSAFLFSCDDFGISGHRRLPENNLRPVTLHQRSSLSHHVPSQSHSDLSVCLLREELRDFPIDACVCQEGFMSCIWLVVLCAELPYKPRGNRIEEKSYLAMRDHCKM